MKTFPAWKLALLALAALISLAYVFPNFLTPSQRASLPGFLPNKALNLGLDLRGGAHLMVEVDLAAVRRERLENILESLRTDFRSANVGYVGLRLVGNEGVTVRLRDPQEFERAREVMARLAAPQQTGLIGLGGGTQLFDFTLDEAGQVNITLTEAAMRERATAAVQQSIEIIRRRIDQTGVAEATIQRVGEDRVLVQLPGEGNPERIKNLLGQTAKLSFHMVNLEANPATGVAPPGSILLPDATNPAQNYVLIRRAEISGENLVDAQATMDQQAGEPVVSFRLDQQGGRRFAEITQNNIGRPFAIVLDGKVISAPVIRSAILGGSGQISGGFTFEAANDLAVLLRAGALPAPLIIVEERTVGPDLGADAIALGETALLVGFLLVVIYMVVAYGLFGIFANIALVLNMLMIFGILTALQATLSLPGMAGILLTLGMAVDANVLINERIREEARTGKPVIVAIEAGFQRAFATILDSNLTTLLAMMILFTLATGPVRGFAVAISIGILTSMFSALLGTRFLIMMWYERRRPASLAF